MKKAFARTKLWFSVYNYTPYQGQGEPDFYDTGSPEFEWVREFHQNLPKIKRELEDYLLQYSPNSHHARFTSSHDAWSTIPLVTWGLRYAEQLSRFPTLCRLLGNVDGLTSASFSKLKAQSSIGVHYGDTNAIIRCHLGIHVPAALPDAGFQVNMSRQSWREGELLAFCDGYVHSAWNTTEHERVIMIIDIIRPEFRHKRGRVCATVLGAMVLHKLLSAWPASKAFLFLPVYIAEGLLTIVFFSLSPVYNLVSQWRRLFGCRRHRR